MKKRIAAMILVFAMLTASLMGCNSGTESKETEGGKANPGSNSADTETKGIFNENGFPIVNEEITLTIGVAEATEATKAKHEDLNVIKYIEEISGVNLEFIYYNEETASLMFADGDYPDVMVEMQTSQQIWDAVQAGDVYVLDDLIEQYSPNWSKYLAENEREKQLITYGDGHIYSLPIVREEPVNTGLRDQWLIRKDWLDELGLEVPTTVEEFYDV